MKQVQKVTTIVNEYINKENNWLLTEIEVQLDGIMVDRHLHVVNMNTGKRPQYIDDVWEYEWEKLEDEENNE